MRLWTSKEIEAKAFWWPVDASEFIIKRLFQGAERRRRMDLLKDWAVRRMRDRKSLRDAA